MDETKGLEIYKLIGDIAYLATMINSLTDYCIFFNFSGHVHLLDVKVSQSKELYNEHLIECGCYIEPSQLWGYQGNNFERLNNIKYKLKEILQDKNIDYSNRIGGEVHV